MEEQSVNFIPLWQRWFETLLIVPIAAYGMISSVSNLEYSLFPQNITQHRLMPLANDNGLAGKSDKVVHKPVRRNTEERILNYLEEKLRREAASDKTRSRVFRIYSTLVLIRTSSKSPWTTQLFRFQLYTVPGALIALIFPILNTRLLSGEVAIYYIQHLFILVIPVYLMLAENTYAPESIGNLSWPTFSLSAILLYHFALLQPAAYASQVNLNCILCPAVSDPFSGRWWRWWAIGHQSAVIPLVTKLYGFVAFYFIEFLDHAGYTKRKKRS